MKHRKTILMLKILTLGLMAASISADTFAADSVPLQPYLRLDVGKASGHVSPLLYGLMTEEINYSYDGGLYGELIQNRIFRDSARSPVHWMTVQDPNVGGVEISLDETQPIETTALTTSLKIRIHSASATQPAGAANDGFWGIPVKPGTVYHASFWAKASGDVKGAPLTLSIEDKLGRQIFATASVAQVSEEWKKYTATLITPQNVAPTLQSRFAISTEKTGTLWLNLVSLFGPTYNGRPNGNRPDLMQMMADMKPKFLRFPGGDFLEGPYLSDHFPWKKTIGPLEQRPGHYGRWRYGASDGLGLLEFMQWCEDLKMEPVLAVYAGLSLDGEYLTGPALQPFVDDALDEIEYLTGDAKTTKWGRVRAQDGHPSPFIVHYVEIGNEDFYDKSGSYESRFIQFFDAIKAKYPKIQCISTIGANDPAVEQAIAAERKPDLVDEHFYRTEGEMEDTSVQYDSYDRNGPRIFVGEWATREGQPTGNMKAALGDAAWLTGIERNSDIVVMASYAPLFVNVNWGAMQWSPNMIGYNGLTCYGSPSYYVQEMFGNYLGDVVVPISSDGIPTQTWQPPPPKPKPGEAPQPAPPPKQIPTLYFVATRTSATGTIDLKVVNSAGFAQSVKIDIRDVASVDSEGTLVTLKADKPEDTNSITEPKKIVPVISKVINLGNSFTQTFAPYSVNVLQIDAH